MLVSSKNMLLTALSLQNIGAVAQLERDEIQKAVSTCNDLAEAERRSMHDLKLETYILVFVRNPQQ